MISFSLQVCYQIPIINTKVRPGESFWVSPLPLPLLAWWSTSSKNGEATEISLTGNWWRTYHKIQVRTAQSDFSSWRRLFVNRELNDVGVAGVRLMKQIYKPELQNVLFSVVANETMSLYFSSVANRLLFSLYSSPPGQQRASGFKTWWVCLLQSWTTRGQHPNDQLPTGAVQLKTIKLRQKKSTVWSWTRHLQIGFF